jgi:hypothetical protein
MAHHLLCHDNNGSTASETYRQIDVLSPLDAGLRHLDLPQQVSSLCYGYYAGDADAAHISLELMPSPSIGAQCYVRTYGSEPEMYLRPDPMARVRRPLIYLQFKRLL